MANPTFPAIRRKVEAWTPDQNWGIHDIARALLGFVDGVLAAVPCALGRTDCAAPEGRWAPCCAIRLGMLAGEPTEADGVQLIGFHVEPGGK